MWIRPTWSISNNCGLVQYSMFHRMVQSGMNLVTDKQMKFNSWAKRKRVLLNVALKFLTNILYFSTQIHGLYLILPPFFNKCNTSFVWNSHNKCNQAQNGKKKFNIIANMPPKSKRGPQFFCFITWITLLYCGPNFLSLHSLVFPHFLYVALIKKRRKYMTFLPFLLSLSLFKPPTLSIFFIQITTKLSLFTCIIDQGVCRCWPTLIGVDQHWPTLTDVDQSRRITSNVMANNVSFFLRKISQTPKLGIWPVGQAPKLGIWPAGQAPKLDAWTWD